MAYDMLLQVAEVSEFFKVTVLSTISMDRAPAMLDCRSGFEALIKLSLEMPLAHIV
jgi:hypothetical protein